MSPDVFDPNLARERELVTTYRVSVLLHPRTSNYTSFLIFLVLNQCFTSETIIINPVRLLEIVISELMMPQLVTDGSLKRTSSRMSSPTISACAHAKDCRGSLWRVRRSSDKILSPQLMKRWWVQLRKAEIGST